MTRAAILVDMRVIADLHTHSRFSRAVSKDMDLEHLASWAGRKGVTLVAAPDFTHPEWFRELRAGLEEDGSGFCVRRGGSENIRFVLSSEICCIFNRGGATRRIHVLVYAPSFAAVEHINAQLGWRGNLRADGRPMLGLDVKELFAICQRASPGCLLVPAHVWTPWFGLYGSKSGFDHFAECFEELTDQIPAVETGLSSDPAMNWRLRELDGKTIISSSDAHSPPNLGREATVFELRNLAFANLAAALRLPFPAATDADRIVMTVEFFPEEGMYHWDGHRAHNLRWSPEETKRHNGVCSVCGQPVTVGVMHRVDALADRPVSFRDERRPPFRRMVPVAEIIGEALSVGKLSKSVAKEYDALMRTFGAEFTILLDTPVDDLRAATLPRIAEGIARVRAGQLTIAPGYDGVYGTVRVFTEDERSTNAAGQGTLF